MLALKRMVMVLSLAAAAAAVDVHLWLANRGPKSSIIWIRMADSAFADSLGYACVLAVIQRP